MKVIFVRHGQTAENLAHRHQPEHTPLTIAGRKQAVAAGEKLASAGVTHIVSSPLVRALQTASLIADRLEMIPSIDHSLVEIGRPRSLTGHKHHSSRSLFFYFRWYLGLIRVGETYAGLRARIALAKANIEKLPPDATVLIVSHSVFLKMFMVHVCSNRAVSPIKAIIIFFSLSKIKNTQMLEFECSSVENGCGWLQTDDLNLS